MSIGFAKPHDPRHLPEQVLWRLTKNGRFSKCRTRMVPIGDGRPEIRLDVSRLETGELDLLWSQVMTDGRDVGELSDAKKRDFEAKGWSEDRSTLRRTGSAMETSLATRANETMILGRKSGGCSHEES